MIPATVAAQFALAVFFFAATIVWAINDDPLVALACAVFAAVNTGLALA